MKYRLLHTFINILSGMFILFPSFNSLFAIGSQAEGYKVNRSNIAQIWAHGECREVRAPGNYDIFVPTNDPTLEWYNSKIGIPRIEGAVNNCTRQAYCGGSAGSIPTGVTPSYNSWPYGYIQTYTWLWTPVYNWQYNASNVCGYTCSNNYQWSGSSCIYCPAGNHIESGSCIPDQRQVSCSGYIPSNASDNNYWYWGQFTQYWVGYWGSPFSQSWTYQPYGESCTFSCKSGYSWNGSYCEAPPPPPTGNCALAWWINPNGPHITSNAVIGIVPQGDTWTVPVGSEVYTRGADLSQNGNQYTCPLPPSCTNGYSNYPTCGPTTCTNGATNPPACDNNLPPRPTITQSRTPNPGRVGDSAINTWSTTNATSIHAKCWGQIIWEGDLPASGIQNGMYDSDQWIGATYCDWIAYGPGGQSDIHHEVINVSAANTPPPNYCDPRPNYPHASFVDGSPYMLGQNWVKDAGSCGYYCTNGYTGNQCEIAPLVYTYNWIESGFGQCSVSCGGGTQSKSVECKRNDGVTVSDGLCSGAKPATSQACNTQSCSEGPYCEIMSIIVFVPETLELSVGNTSVRYTTSTSLPGKFSANCTGRNGASCTDIDPSTESAQFTCSAINNTQNACMMLAGASEMTNDYCVAYPYGNARLYLVDTNGAGNLEYWQSNIPSQGSTIYQSCGTRKVLYKSSATITALPNCSAPSSNSCTFTATMNSGNNKFPLTVGQSYSVGTKSRNHMECKCDEGPISYWNTMSDQNNGLPQVGQYGNEVEAWLHEITCQSDGTWSDVVNPQGLRCVKGGEGAPGVCE